MARREKNKPRKTKVKSESEPDLKETKDVSVDPQTTANVFNWRPLILIFVFGVALYANTWNFEYVLDDKLYIIGNEYTKKGFDGIKEIWTNDMMTGFFGKKKNLVEGGRYRPLALTTHAIEWQIFGKNATVSHIINIILYGFLGVVLLLVLQQIFEGESRDRWWWTIPIVATMLFLAHPTHTEVGANIKSRDEILSVLFGLVSFWGVLRYVKRNELAVLILSGVCFWLSLASKESTVTFLGVVPLTLIFFFKLDIKKWLIALSPLIIATAAYMLLRLSVLGTDAGSLEVAQELMNKPYLNATDSERLASIFFTMGLYIKLLIFPHPLTHDYYPFHPFATFNELGMGASGYASWSEPLAIAAVVAYGALLVFGLYTLWKRLKTGTINISGYGALFYIGTFILFSNLFFDIGAFMNERFLFIPSLGFALPLAWLFVDKLGTKKGLNTGVLLATGLILAYSFKTVTRNYAWESDRSLAMADVDVSDGSAKIKMTMGSELLDDAKDPANASRKQAILKEAESYELQSLEIYPGYFPPLDILGNIYFEMNNYEYSIYYFSRALSTKSYDKRLRRNMEAVANNAVKLKDFESAIKGYEVLLKLYKGEEASRVHSALGEVYGKELQDLPNSLKHLRLARKSNPQNSSAYQKLGIVYAMTGQADSALANFNKCYALDTTNARVLLNIGVLYRQMGNVELGERYMQKAMEMDPSVAPDS